jgi:hypothetical protein
MQPIEEETMSSEVEKCQKLRIREIAKEAMKGCLLEVYRSGDWTPKADALSAAVIEILLNLADRRSEGRKNTD